MPIPTRAALLAPISVVDDDRDVREALRFNLQVEGYRVELYETAEALLDRDHWLEGCLVVDQYLPGMTGLELTALLRAKGFAVPVVLITGRPAAGLRRRAAAAGVTAILEKPICGSALVKAVERAFPLDPDQTTPS